MRIEEIKTLLENHFKINLTNRTRDYEHIKIRFFYYYCCFMYSSEYLTYKKVGDSIGFDGATVRHGVKEYDNIIRVDKNFKRQCNEIESKLINTFKEIIDIDEAKQKHIKLRIEFFNKYLKA